MSLTTTNHPLYFEVRGNGDPVLLVPGTPGDSGQFEDLAEILTEQYTVITYDRAGAARSGPSEPRDVAGHAADAAALLRHQTDKPAVVYGTSNGALVALELALGHPELVQRAILHEPPLLSVLVDPEPVGAMLGQLIGAAMEAGGPARALDAFLRFAYADEVVDAWPSELTERMMTNAGYVFEVELPAFQSYRPDPAALKASGVPMVVAVGEDQAAPFFLEAAQWLAERLGVEVRRSPGAHGPQFTCPRELAAFLF